MRKIVAVVSVLAVAMLACAIATGCQKAEEPSYQAVVVCPQKNAGELFCVQTADGQMTSGLIVLSLPEKTDVDPASLAEGDVIDVFGSEAIAMSYPGQASCTNIKLSGHIEGDAYSEFEAEWKVFEGRLGISEQRRLNRLYS